MIASSQKKRCACPSFAAVPTQLEPTTNSIWVRTRSRSPSGFLRAALCCSTSRSARSSWVVMICRGTVPSAQASDTNASTALHKRLIRLRFYRRRGFVSKFAVADFPAGIRDVESGGQRGHSEQHHREGEWHGKFRPSQRHDDPG